MNYALVSIRHLTRYTYDPPVRLGGHTLRFQPRSNSHQRLHEHHLSIEPAPIVRTEGLDVEGNATTHAWFEGEADRLQVEAASTVETRLVNPYDYLLPGEATRLPPECPPDLKRSLAPYLPPGPKDEKVALLAEEARKEGSGETVAFLARLNERIHRDFTPLKRPEGPAWPAHETLARGEGTCRDLTVLFMDCARSVGLAARFVSGYHVPVHEDAGRELHAWPETYLPGVGWRGYDPTEGLVVADRHVAVAAAPSPEGAAPVSGPYFGQNVTSRLTTEVEARRVAPTG